MVIGTVTVGDALCRPHKPVRLYLKAGARTMMVRSLKNLGKLGPVLPHGPLQQFSYNDEEEEELSNNARYALFMERLEREAVSLMAIDDKEAKQILGRAQGPQFVQKDALESRQQGTRKTTSVSRAWRRTAGWLSDLLNTSILMAKEEAMRKLLTYHHPSPLHLKATPSS